MASIHDAMDKQLYCQVLLLLERIPEVDVKDDKGMTIVMKCCYIDDVRTAKVIAKRTLKYGADINMTDLSGKDVLCHTAITNNVTLAKLLLRNDNLDLIRKDNDGNTALHQAAIRGHVAIIEVITSPILKYRLPVDVRNGEGMTPLMLACRHGHVETARYLVNECNASLTMRDDVRFMSASDWLSAALIVPSHLDYRKRQQTRNRMLTDCYKALQGCTGANKMGLPEGKRCLPESNLDHPCRTRSFPARVLSTDCVPGGATNIARRTTSVPRRRSFSPGRDAVLIKLFTLHSAQCSPSYCPPAKPPPPPVPQQSKQDEMRSRRQVTRSRFQKLMRIKRAESIIASLRRGATTSNEFTRKSSDQSPKIQHLVDNLFLASKQSKSTLDVCRNEE